MDGWMCVWEKCLSSYLSVYRNVKTNYCFHEFDLVSWKRHILMCGDKTETDFSCITHPDLGKLCVLHYLRRNALQKPQIRCSSGPCLPGLREQRRSHKHSGCVRRLPPLLLSMSRPRLSLKTLSHRCWRSHFAATCDNQSCESPLNKKRDEFLQQVFIWFFCPRYFF